MKRLHRKSFSVKILIPFWKFHKARVFRFKQGTLAELLEMTEWVEKSEDFQDYLFYFLNEKCEGKISKKEFAKLSEKYLLEIYQFLQKTFAKGFFKKNKTEVTIENYAPLSSSFTYLCDKASTSLKELLNLTWEQIEFLFEGLEWNARAGTKSGQRQNKMIAMKKLTDTKFGDSREQEKERLNQIYKKFYGKRQ